MAHSIAMWITNYSSEYTLHMILIREYRKRSGKTKRDNVTCDNVTTHYALGVVTPFVFFLANTKQAKRHVVTLSRCHVFKKWTRGIGIQRIVYINIYLYILFFEHFSPPLMEVQKQKRDNVTMWQCDNEPSHHHPLHTLQRTMQRATNQSFTLFAIVTSSCSTPVHLLHFTVVNGASTPFFYPPFSRKNWRKEKRFQRKCVTLWGRLTASTS